jgi:ParB-like chromosome segregation protein Spo0J
LVTLRKAGFSNHEIAEVIGYETASAVTAVIQLLDLEPEV